MGPAAWVAVGKALTLALGTSLFNGRNSLPGMLARQIHHAIVHRELEMAEALLRDLAFRHEAAFGEFMSRYADELPPELSVELGWPR